MTGDDPFWLEQILAAIDEAQAGPTAEDLAAAPLLDPWHPILTLDVAPLLMGHVSGHPILGTTRITTSRLITLDPGDRWARTCSRWYRLGRPIGQPVADPEGMRSRTPTRGDMARLALDVARLGCLPVSNRALLDRLMASFVAQLRAHWVKAAAERAARH
ncbi:ATP-dependent Lon protease [Paracoccus sp. YIM 132242]|uniref:ATP-dependent Lon protease n=1 Tax=Paracoccus lichenicola TaxID=2665644 RepID=A0A6L6HV11_9RHOB|nr:DUF6634 family protein [Paracoccus lichenicola]MTE02091.1 ATP-dependent Lon protease [Paracoccus lichenicola]